MKTVSMLIFFALLTGLFIASSYAGIVIEDKSIHPQDKPPGKFERSQDNLVTLSDGRKLEFVRIGDKRQVYLIQKNGTRALADGAFTLPNGQKLNISKGVILENR